MWQYLGKGPKSRIKWISVEAVLVLPHIKTSLGTKLLCLSQRYLPLFAYTQAKFETVEALLKGHERCLKVAT